MSEGEGRLKTISDRLRRHAVEVTWALMVTLVALAMLIASTGD